MIVYRDRRETIDGAKLAREIAARLRRARGAGGIRHENATRMLIDFGELEAALVDAKEGDGVSDDSVVGLLRDTSLSIGHLFYWSWEGSAVRMEPWARRIERSMDRIVASRLPKTLRIPVSEGYAYYSLAPETYLEAAKEFRREAGPADVVCIGIRSIGTSLCAVVAATLEELGCRVESYTVRCGGHPFDRSLLLDVVMTERIRTLQDRHWLIVDEGPGLSGSTLCCVADRLSELGVPDGKIVFFPSHDPDPARLLSVSAQDRWPRHRKYLAEFDDVWVHSGRLMRSLPEGRLVDVSAGRWRALLFDDESAYPAVQPWHERRKYVLYPTESRPLLLKFAGFGRYGESAYDRAALLAQVGSHPPVVGLYNGFLATQLIPGVPMRSGDINEPFFDHVVRHLAWLRRAPATAEPMSQEEWTQMIEVNVGEGLGPRWADRLRRMGLAVPAESPATGFTDGRMLLHEWLRMSEGYVKTDSVDHYADHFSPGCSDSTWDVAACLVEWALSPSMRGRLLDRYIDATGDADLPKRLPFYAVAYLAHRLGYATMAAETLGHESADGRRFEVLADRYARLLKQRLSQRERQRKGHIGWVPSA